MTGMAGYNSFIPDSAMDPVLMSHLAPYCIYYHIKVKFNSNQCYLHEQPVYVCTFQCILLKSISLFFRHFTGQTHFVQWEFIFPGCALHDRCEEWLWVEKPGEPDWSWKIKIWSPHLKLLYPKDKIIVPGRQSIQGGIGSFCPSWWNLQTKVSWLQLYLINYLIQEKCIRQILHVRCCC